MVSPDLRLALVVGVAVAVLACRPSTRAPLGAADVLLFSGQGTSANDVAALERVLGEARIRYAVADSAQLDAFTAADYGRFRLLIVPGGNFEALGNSLRPQTTALLRAAVRDGLGYLGLCAGAFFAGASPYNGLDLTGVRYRFYSAEARGVRKAIVPLSFADGRSIDHYWEDGPELSGWGRVVARYPDGAPAIVQGAIGRGWVVLTGVHPEAPAAWWKPLSPTPSPAAANEVAAALVDAALHHRALPTF